MKSPMPVLYFLIMLLLFAGCGIDSGKNTGSGGFSPNYGLNETGGEDDTDGTTQVTDLPPPDTDKKWVTAGVTLPQALWDHASIVWNGYIYTSGGHSSCDGTSSECGFAKKVYYARLNIDGSIGDFVSTSPLIRYLRGHSMVAYNNYVYIIGGIVQPFFVEPPYPDPTTFETVLNEKVYYAHINPDRSVGEWKETAPLYLPDLPPERQDKAGLFAISSAVHNVNGTGYIYVTGGWNAELKKNVKTLLVGPINADGSITKWIHNDKSDLPYDTGLSKHASVVASVNGDNYLYIIGGNSGDIGSQVFHREIYYAKIADDGLISSDGSSSPWRPVSSMLPVQLIDHAAVAIDRFIFVLGGRNRDENWGYTPYSDVYYYFINDNGDLGPLRRYPSMPSPLFHHASVADTNTANIYVTGGAAGDTEKEENRKSSVYYLIKTN